ncbi:TlpA family protein disulfide reductase [Algoriphagus sp. AGSA1]|uniref:TlpA family protein disulfide reductase n=1 Tax=Algoriphagus sp. AGSA1 TaxID=2907213 RepID=UPI001F1F5995|nr:TlpA disulfide reductase family protein [Algoriphagus sp. AGSA1]MCE7056704.1 TlpA family protein disulfide reductase [Algoriphagus sp. AGSA1]
MVKNNPVSKNALSWIICLGILVISFFRCQPELKDQHHVVLVLEDSSVSDFLSQKKASLHFLGENSLPEKIEFLSDTAFTQLRVVVNNDWSELVYKENNQSIYSYIFQKGDSVLLRIRERQPWMEVVNRTSKEYDINWEAIRNRDLIKRKPTSLEDFYFLWNSSYNSLVPVNMESELLMAKISAKEGLDREKACLDSLVEKGLLTNSYSELLVERNRFERSKIELFEIEKGTFDAIAAMQTFSGENSAVKDRIYLDEFSDFLLGQLIAQHPDKMDKIIGGTTHSYFSQLMLYKHLERQVQELSFAEVDELLTKNRSKLPNEWESTLRASIEKLLNQEPDIEIQGLGQKHLTFDDLLAIKRGKFLYVDLWAAWCLPCIRSFPESRLLNEDYQSKGFEVVYLSVDKNHKFWENVILKYEISFPERSYIVMNIDESEYLKTLNIDLIPRYLLFDPEGKLIHQNAPRPASREIRILLDSLSS